MTFGGNGAITVGGNKGSVLHEGGFSAQFDDTYKDYDGTKSIRVLTPCTGDPSTWGTECGWFDDASVLSMQKSRWYSTAETLADGTVVLIGGFANGGYINRNNPYTKPNWECTGGGAAENTYEFWPARGEAKYMDFMCKTAGLNSYAHAFLMPSGNMFVQANYSTSMYCVSFILFYVLTFWISVMWDYNNNVETPLPDMPGQIVRVYPASGAVAMLPLTPANNYNPTILFCGGVVMTDEQWGDYSWPSADTWNIPASNDCQRITPEPTDGSPAAYVKDDDMMVGRTMGQFVILPTGKLLVLNGGANGTAGYAERTGTTDSYSKMPNGMSLSSGPTLKPAIYDPAAPAGQRWSDAGLSESKIPRLYHSTALLLPDGSVMVAGSNPNVDVNLTTTFPTTYTAEYFYPSYFSAPVRPSPSGVPKTISYGGSSFDITIPASSYSGSANDAAANASVVLLRPGWTTHAMSMGQRFLQLNHTYNVNADGSFVLHTAQHPPNANLLTPGPALLYVVVNGVPSNGTQVIVGNGKMGQQTIGAAAALPESVRNDAARGSVGGSGSSNSSNGGTGTNGADGSQTTNPSAAGHTLPSLAAAALVAAVAVMFS
jgi:hypothetical protein